MGPSGKDCLVLSTGIFIIAFSGILKVGNYQFIVHYYYSLKKHVLSVLCTVLQNQP
jgi:hypothetical protein